MASDRFSFKLTEDTCLTPLSFICSRQRCALAARLLAKSFSGVNSCGCPCSLHCFLFPQMRTACTISQTSMASQWTTGVDHLQVSLFARPSGLMLVSVFSSRCLCKCLLCLPGTLCCWYDPDHDDDDDDDENDDDQDHDEDHDNENNYRRSWLAILLLQFLHKTLKENSTFLISRQMLR